MAPQKPLIYLAPRAGFVTGWINAARRRVVAVGSRHNSDHSICGTWLAKESASAGKGNAVRAPLRCVPSLLIVAAILGFDPAHAVLAGLQPFQVVAVTEANDPVRLKAIVISHDAANIDPAPFGQITGWASLVHGPAGRNDIVSRWAGGPAVFPLLIDRCEPFLGPKLIGRKFRVEMISHIPRRQIASITNADMRDNAPILILDVGWRGVGGYASRLDTRIGALEDFGSFRLAASKQPTQW